MTQSIRFLMQRFFYQNKIPYLIYYHLYRKNRGIKIYLPDKKTDLHLAGYPRSGNTFSTFLVKDLIISKSNEKINLITHLHSVAGLKIANSLKVKGYFSKYFRLITL